MATFLSKISFLFLSYLIGSIPFGFVFTFLFARKNILEIGWRKTSGSNVFKNVGKIPGILTGIFDLLKGFLVVYLAKELNLSQTIQALAGVLAILGHNWSIYLKFAGGRGIGTFIGAGLGLNAKILAFSLIPFAILGLVWNASIGTILFLATAIFLSFYFNQFQPFGFFTLISLLPIFVKRLSPVKELKKDNFLNRLIFDDNVSHFELRILKLLKKFDKKQKEIKI